MGRWRADTHTTATRTANARPQICPLDAKPGQGKCKNLYMRAPGWSRGFKSWFFPGIKDWTGGNWGGDGPRYGAQERARGRAGGPLRARGWAAAAGPAARALTRGWQGRRRATCAARRRACARAAAAARRQRLPTRPHAPLRRRWHLPGVPAAVHLRRRGLGLLRPTGVQHVQGCAPAKGHGGRGRGEGGRRTHRLACVLGGHAPRAPRATRLPPRAPRCAQPVDCAGPRKLPAANTAAAASRRQRMWACCAVPPCSTAQSACAPAHAGAAVLPQRQACGCTARSGGYPRTSSATTASSSG